MSEMFTAPYSSFLRSIKRLDIFLRFCRQTTRSLLISDIVQFNTLIQKVNMGKERNHFIVLDSIGIPPIIQNILKPFSSQEHLIISLESPPEIGAGFVSFSPKVSDEEFGGVLSIPSHHVLLLGSSSSSKLGFPNMGED